MDFRIKGIKDMRREILRVATEHPVRVKAALYHEAQIEVTEMKRRTPVDTTANAPHPGNLRNSIHAEEPQHDGRRFFVQTATGMQAPYAIYVHENPYAFHPIGQWKFMESVINESRQYIAERIAARMRLDG